MNGGWGHEEEKRVILTFEFLEMSRVAFCVVISSWHEMEDEDDGVGEGTVRGRW